MTKQNRTTLIIADDHPLVLSGIRSELEDIEEFEIIAQAGNGEEALNLIIHLNPDVAILDFQMPGLNGIEIVKMLKELNSKTKVILLTMHDEKQIFFKAIEEGVDGYILKDEGVLEIVEAVRSVISGREFVSNDLTGVMLERLKKTGMGHNNENLVSELTHAEKQILLLIAELSTNEEISDRLFISKRTVENYKVNIAKKLGLESARDLLKYSIENKKYLETP